MLYSFLMQLGTVAAKHGRTPKNSSGVSSLVGLATAELEVDVEVEAKVELEVELEVEVEGDVDDDVDVDVVVVFVVVGVADVIIVVFAVVFGRTVVLDVFTSEHFSFLCFGPFFCRESYRAERGGMKLVRG
jgi:hypothetical protein